MPERDSRSIPEIRTHVIQVSNVSPSAGREQLHQMLSYLGRIEEMKLFPSETNPLCATALSKLCYVRFDDTSSAAATQHLTNTPLIDRAIICVPVPEDRIPDEDTALRIGGPALPGQRVLPPHIVNQIQLVGGQQCMVTMDPTLTSMGLPNYPPLPSNIDAIKLEETRRTIYVGNISQDASAEELLDFFNENIGEVMYMRFAGANDLPVRYLYVEFTNQMSIPVALQKNGILFKGEQLKIQHSTVSIVKPRAMTQDMAKREVEEAARKAEAAGPLVSKALGDADDVMKRYSVRSALDNAVSRAAASVGRSRSPSWGRGDRWSRGRSRSRSPDRGGGRRGGRGRSRSKSKSPPWSRRRGGRSPSPRRRVRDRGRGWRRRSPSRDRDRNWERDRRRRRSRSRSGSGNRRDRSDRDRDRDRERDRDKRDRERRAGGGGGGGGGGGAGGREREKEERELANKEVDRERDEEMKSMKMEEINEEPGGSQPESERIQRPQVKLEHVSMDVEHEIKQEKVDEPYEAKKSSPPPVQPEGHVKREGISDEEGEADKDDKGSHSRGKKKEKRKKDKKEKKKKKDRSSRKKKSSKARPESTASEDDGASSASSDKE